MSKNVLIKVHNFSKHFGNHVLHHNIQFELNKGELFGLLGGSGVGKSVILRCLIGLDRPSSGQIFLFDQDCASFTPQDWMEMRKRISYAFQNGALFDSMTVYDNIAFPLREHTNWTEDQIQRKVMDTLELFHLAESANKYPSQLSGGMQKRLGLARALMLNPEVILYDEPTAGLDPYNTLKIQEMILQLKKLGIAGILVTHDMPVAFHLCDRLGLISLGKILAVDTPQNIEKDPHHPIQLFAQGYSYQKILEAQNAKKPI